MMVCEPVHVAASFVSRCIRPEDLCRFFDGGFGAEGDGGASPGSLSADAATGDGGGDGSGRHRRSTSDTSFYSEFFEDLHEK